jgi:hypothetical protein
MKHLTFSNISGIFGAAALTLFSISPAQASPWQYGLDLFNDGYEGNLFGASSKFEFYGMALTQTEDQIFLALNANLSEDGYSYSAASGGNVEWGDLFLNFSGKNYDAAINDGNMLAIHFTGTSDSGVSQSGLYQVKSAKSVASINSGYSTLQAHANHNNREGVGNIAYQTYFNANSELKNVIMDGSKIGSINFLKASELNAQGLNFASQGAVGTQTFGFSFNKNDIPKELRNNQLIASIWAECNNDGMGIVANNMAFPTPTPVPTVTPIPVPPIPNTTPTEIPEPSTALGLLAFGAVVKMARRRQAK